MINFFDLQPDTLSDYVAQARDFDGLWFFQHVPKTAGSSLVSEMANHAAPYVNLNIGHTKPATGIPYHEHRKLRTKEFAESHKSQPVRTASGHLVRENMDFLRNHLSMQVFSFVRHPVKRVISEWFYSRSSMHSAQESFIAKFPTVEDFIRAPDGRDKMKLFMYGRRKASEEQLLEFLRDNFAFIGMQERFADSFSILSSILWERSQPSMPKMRVLANDESAKLRDEHEELIMEMNREDMIIYNAVEAVFDRLGADIETLLSRPPSPKARTKPHTNTKPKVEARAKSKTKPETPSKTVAASDETGDDFMPSFTFLQ